MGFRPEDNRPSERDESKGKGWVPGGKYVLAIVHVKLVPMGSGGKRARFRCRVLWGADRLEKYVGHTVYLSCGMNVHSEGQARMLGAICNAMGLTNADEFEPTSVREVRRAMMYRPFATDLKYAQKGEYHNNDWGKLFRREECSQSMLDKMHVWRDDLIAELGEPNANDEEESQGGGGYDGDPGPSDEDAPRGANWF